MMMAVNSAHHGTGLCVSVADEVTNRRTFGRALHDSFGICGGDGGQQRSRCHDRYDF